MKKLLKFLKWVGIGWLALLIAFLAINAFDEKLDPGAAAILDAKPTIAPKENTYFYLAGLTAPPGQDPTEFGQQCITRFLVAAKNKKEMMAILSGGKQSCWGQENTLGSQYTSLKICNRQHKSCFSQIRVQSTAIYGLAEKDKVLLQRYEQLLTMRQFEDIPYYSPLTPFPLFGVTNKLYSALSIVKLQEGNTADFVQRTAAEVKFQRMVLRGNGSLISKFVALAAIRRAAHLTSDVIHAYPKLARQHQTVLLAIAQPLSVPERSLDSAMASEIRFFATNLAPIGEASFFDRWLSHFTLKPNATTNYFYHGMRKWRGLSQLPTEQYLAAEQGALAQLPNPWQHGYVSMIYNPIGKVLAGIGSTPYSSYLRRIIDVDGYLRLVSLQIQISAQQIQESEIPAFLKNTALSFRDPYTGNPMQWEKARGLYFKGRSEKLPDKDGFISVKL